LSATDPERLRLLGEAEEPRSGVARIYGLRGSEGVTEVLLIRHAQMPPASTTGEDRPLTELGREQAEVLASYLAGYVRLSAVYSSPMLRTLETARPIARAQGLEVEVVHDLREIEAYIPEGMTLREYVGEEKFAAMQESFIRERRWDLRAGLYESSASLRKRIVGAVDAVIERHRGGSIAVVTHGPVINAYVASVLQSPLDLLFQPKLTSITLVLAREDLRGIAVLNSTPHFGTL
jgi:probable phosphoglycerate mutase